MVSMLYKTNIFGIVGSDNNPDYKQNQVLIWDDLSEKIAYKITATERVLNLKLRRDRIFIVCKNKIYVVNSKGEYYIPRVIDTGLNPNGLIAISYNEENTVIVYPSSDENKNKGELTVENLDDKSINGEPNNKKKKLENNNKNLKSKKGESPMLEINKNQLKSVQKLKKNDRKNNRDKKHRNKKDYNRMNNRKIQEETEAKFSWEKVSEKEEEEKFMNFEKDLKDYLRRTISANRQNEFFSNVIPESLDIVKNLFQKITSNLMVKFY